MSKLKAEEVKTESKTVSKLKAEGDVNTESRRRCQHRRQKEMLKLKARNAKCRQKEMLKLKEEQDVNTERRKC